MSLFCKKDTPEEFTLKDIIPSFVVLIVLAIENSKILLTGETS